MNGIDHLREFEYCERERDSVPMVHGRMLYRCENCGERWFMYLEKGIEEFGENHKPSPFTIGCPYCGGWASDVSGIQKVPGGGYVPLRDGYSYFANMEDRDCGVPVYREEKRQYEDEAEKINKLALVIAEKTGISLEEAVTVVLRAMLEKEAQQFLAENGGMIATVQGEPQDRKTAWDRKEARETRRAVDRAATSRFRQYEARESVWSAQKRTGTRRREWRGPWKES